MSEELKSFIEVVLMKANEKVTYKFEKWADKIIDKLDQQEIIFKSLLEEIKKNNQVLTGNIEIRKLKINKFWEYLKAISITGGILFLALKEMLSK